VSAVGAAFGRFAAFVNGLAHVAVWLMPLVAGLVLVVILAVRVWFPRRASDVLVKLLSLEEERPRIRRVWRRGACWRLAWKMPVGVISEKVLEQRTAMEQPLDCSLRACWYERGLVRAEFGVAGLPQRLSWRDFRRRVERRHAAAEGSVPGEGRLLLHLRHEQSRDPGRCCRRVAAALADAGPCGLEGRGLGPGGVPGAVSER
jgi:hypothetical protein